MTLFNIILRDRCIGQGVMCVCRIAVPCYTGPLSTINERCEWIIRFPPGYGPSNLSAYAWALIIQWAQLGLPLSDWTPAPRLPLSYLRCGGRSCIRPKVPYPRLVSAFSPRKLGSKTPPQCWPQLGLETALISDLFSNDRDHTGARPFH